MKTLLNCTGFTRGQTSLASLLLKGVAYIITASSTQAMDETIKSICGFEGLLCPEVQQFFAKDPVCHEIAEDYNQIIGNPEKRGTILRSKFDASYGADDCQTQAILMMSIMDTYGTQLFNDLPADVQTTLKAMHALTKYYLNIRDEFTMVIQESKGIGRITYPPGNNPTRFPKKKGQEFDNDILKSIGTGLSKTAIANLKRLTLARVDLHAEFTREPPLFSPTCHLPQTLTTLGFEVLFDYMRQTKTPLLLKVTHIIGTKVSQSTKDIQYRGQQGILLLETGELGPLQRVPESQWEVCLHRPVFALRVYSVKCAFQNEKFEGYAQQLHEANDLSDYLNILALPEFRSFLFALNARDDIAKGRKTVCEGLGKYFSDVSKISYDPTYWTLYACGPKERQSPPKKEMRRTIRSIPMETPHVYVTTLQQQLQSLKNLTSVIGGIVPKTNKDGAK